MAAVSLLTLQDLEPLVEHICRHVAGSGAKGTPIYTPYPYGHELDHERLLRRHRHGWKCPLAEPDWRRTWGAREGGRIVGHVELQGGHIPSELHRATLGLGVETGFRGSGLGQRLLQAALDFARDVPELDWVDLGVFAHNAPALHLYVKEGFQRIGCVHDRFRVEGESIDDIQMTLWVGAPR